LYTRGLSDFVSKNHGQEAPNELNSNCCISDFSAVNGYIFIVNLHEHRAISTFSFAVKRLETVKQSVFFSYYFHFYRTLENTWLLLV